ncbi:MAG: 3-dehydroquinate synthase [Chloroflexi bacterium]|nr:3-dehydroquinate synthase [Chloroflexota bacterium]
MKTVTVRLGRRSYTIHISPGLLGEAGRILGELGLKGKAVVITDPVLKRLYGKTLLHSLESSGFDVTLLEVPAGEEQKSLETAMRLYEQLTDCFAERTTPVLALGGGVIGDLSGFVAATYLRGVPLVQIPTTLLAQVDSSIGGKVAVDYGRLKNRIGAFYQPAVVIADISMLKTLGSDEISAGLAEIIKYGVIRDARLFAYLERNMERVRALDERALETIIYRSARIKADVVSRDELDTGLRNILNYGHTVGHAVESVSVFEVSHGQAVAIGSVAAAKISHRMGLLPQEELARIERLVSRAGLPARLPPFELDRLMKAMKHDKKVLQGRIRFVLPKAIGEVILSDEVEQALIEQVLLEK